MTKPTDSRTMEEVIFDKYWAHACAHTYGLPVVETRAPGGGYVRQPVDTQFLMQVESALEVRDTIKFRCDVHAAVRCIFEALGRMPSSAEILQKVPFLGGGITNFANAQAGRTA